MTYVETARLDYGDLVSAADVNQVITNLLEVRKKIVTPTGGTSYSQIRTTASLNAQPANVAANWVKSTDYITLYPMTQRIPTRFLVIFQGALNAVSDTVTATIVNGDLWGEFGSTAVPGTGETGSMTVRTFGTASSESINITMMRVFETSSLVTFWNVYPVCRVTQLGSGSGSSYGSLVGKITYREL